MDSLLLELDKIKTGSDRRKEVLSWRDELDEARSKWEPAPQTARALKPLSARAASEREVRRPSRSGAKRVHTPTVARPAAPDAKAAALQQRNAALEMAVLALGEAFEASGGSPTADLQAAMDRLHAAGGVNLSSAAAQYVPYSPGPYVPFSPAQLPTRRAAVDVDDEGATTTPAARCGRHKSTPSPTTPQSDTPASEGAREPEWLVDAAATLEAAKVAAAVSSTRDPSLAKTAP